MRVRVLWCAVIVAASLVACAGTDFSFEAARQVKVGMTQAELQQLMGKPYMVTSKGDSEIWIWSHANAFAGAQSVSFILREGKVAQVPRIPETFK